MNKFYIFFMLFLPIVSLQGSNTNDINLTKLKSQIHNSKLDRYTIPIAQAISSLKSKNHTISLCLLLPAIDDSLKQTYQNDFVYHKNQAIYTLIENNPECSGNLSPHLVKTDTPSIRSPQKSIKENSTADGSTKKPFNVHTWNIKRYKV